MDVLMPLNLRHARTSVRYLDASGISRGMFGGQTIVAARGGDRLGLTLEMTKHGGRTTTGLAERAQLRAWLASLRGRQNAVFAQDKSARRRGSFPTGELLLNNTFANGTTGWTATAEHSLSAADRVLRVRRARVVGAATAAVSGSVSVTQYAPYVARAMLIPGRGTFSLRAQINDSVDGGVVGTAMASGLSSVAYVMNGTSSAAGIHDATTSGVLAGDNFTVPYMSLARCALVDNAPNLLLRSNAFSTSPWSLTNATSSGNGNGAPDGTATDQYLMENTTNGGHYTAQQVAVSSAALDYAFSIYAKAGTRSWCWLEILETTGSTAARAYFNISTGVVGTTSNGTNVSALRTFVVDMGNGWYRLFLVARKSNAATTLQVTFGAASADNTASFAGTSSAVPCYPWHASLVQSSVPAGDRLTTTAAITQQPQTGSVLNLKGLPASTNGLLEIDDQVEVVTALGSELKNVTARLNSDASGLGYLQFEPPIRMSPIDNAPVVIAQPFGRWLFSGDAVGWDNDPGIWTTASAEFEEA